MKIRLWLIRHSDDFAFLLGNESIIARHRGRFKKLAEELDKRNSYDEIPNFYIAQRKQEQKHSNGT